jgi:hypothetical protein
VLLSQATESVAAKTGDTVGGLLNAARQAFGGSFGNGWAVEKSASRKGTARNVSGWLSAVGRLPEFLPDLDSFRLKMMIFGKLSPVMIVLIAALFFTANDRFTA